MENVRPSPDDFDAYFPFACNQLQVSTAVAVCKVVEDEYVSAVQTDRSKTKSKGKKIVPSKGDITSDQSKRDKSVATVPAISSFSSQKQVLICTIYDNADNLVHIKFDKNKHIPRKVFKILGLIINFQMYLTTLTINKGLDDYNMQELCLLIPTTQITDLFLDDTSLKDKNYYQLIEQQNRLRQLSLKRCKIDDKAIKNIAAMLVYPLPASKTLSILNLASNAVTDEGAKVLANSLRSNRHLSYLNLSDNRIGDNGAIALLDILKEFPMTSEEIVESKARLIRHLKKRNDMIAKLAADLRFGDMDKRAVRKKTRPISTAPAKKGKGVEKEVSLKSFPDSDGKSTASNDTYIYEKAISMVDTALGDFEDPFTTKDTKTKGNTLYSLGNNKLHYINFAYNNLSIFSVKKLLDVVMYQRASERRPRGLVNAIIEGNYMPVSCVEMAQINDILETELDNYFRKNSSTKKKVGSARTGK